jgi:Zn-dependent protease
MKNLTLGRIFGISVELHYTFVLLIALVAGLLILFDPINFVAYFSLLFFLFVSVFIHELFHSLVAISQGTTVKKIMLLPIGGIAMTDKMPEKPIEELKMALAGPMFNLVLVAVIAIMVWLVPSIPWPGAEYFQSAEGLNLAILHFPIFTLYWVNLILGAFNLLVPALPLDGGRVLRALLAMRVGFNKATQAASKVSTFFALLLFILGFFAGNIILIIIAVFVYLGAKAESQNAMIQESLRGMSIKPYLTKKPFTLKASLNLADAFKSMRKKNATSALIRKDGAFYYLDIDLLDDVKKVEWKKTKVFKIAQKLPVISLRLTADKVLSRMLEKNLALLPVMEKGRFLGVVEEAKLVDLFQLQKLKNE